MTTQLGNFCGRFPVYITNARYTNNMIQIEYVNNGTGSINLIPVIISSAQFSTYDDQSINKRGSSTSFTRGTGTVYINLTTDENNRISAGFVLGYIITVHLEDVNNIQQTNKLIISQ